MSFFCLTLSRSRGEISQIKRSTRTYWKTSHATCCIKIWILHMSLKYAFIIHLISWSCMNCFFYKFGLIILIWEISPGFLFLTEEKRWNPAHNSKFFCKGVMNAGRCSGTRGQLTRHEWWTPNLSFNLLQGLPPLLP